VCEASQLGYAPADAVGELTIDRALNPPLKRLARITYFETQISQIKAQNFLISAQSSRMMLGSLFFLICALICEICEICVSTLACYNPPHKPA
jgi:hypothetical protein